VAERGFQECDGAGLLFVGEGLAEGEAGVVVDSDMDIFPSRRGIA
jgi:hypothetical protein